MGKKRKPVTKKQPAQNQGEPGLIISHFGVAVQIRFDDGHEAAVKVRRNSQHVVGDRVMVKGERLVSLPRATQLRRRDANGTIRTIAANLDVLGIVTATSPQTPSGFIERAIVAARAADIEPFLVVNKIDLDNTEPLQQQLATNFPAINHVFCVSAKTGKHVEKLADFFKQGRRGAFVGVSGAGKSSLLNALSPELSLQTGELNDNQHGCHTTSAATLIALPEGGELVDTPGFRDFAPVDLSSEDLALWFPGFLSILEKTPCRFRNCRHRSEPGCCIRNACDQGLLPEGRYQLYLQTLNDLETVEAEEKIRRKPL